MTLNSERRPAGAAATVPTPASEDTRHRTGAAVAADRYSAGTLDRWQAARDRATGGRLVLHADPERAAELLCEALGGRAAAYRWAAALTAEVCR